MESISDQTVNKTIDLLEARLQRLEYVLSGHQQTSINEDKRPANRRLRDLEHVLDQLAAKSRVVQDLLRLHACQPDLFHALPPADIPTSLDAGSKLSIVLAAASSYPLTASRLTSIHDTPAPTAEASARLIETQARTARIEIQQDSHLREFAALKQRSVAVIQRWYAVDILRTGECWADIEQRVKHVERLIHRDALTTRRDESIIQGQ